MEHKLKVNDGNVEYVYEAGSDYVRAYVTEEKAKEIIGKNAKKGPLADFPIKVGKFHFAGTITEQKKK